ncbi:MAG TPA: hypothetical protein VKZ79_02535 [Alphaproteobacteria bacterium]|nr:hypothetical protein [Alphaproteobacteria bacterium]
MKITIAWPRFLVVSVLGSIVMLGLYMLWQTTPIVSDLAAGYPARPVEEQKPLLPFLLVVSIIQLVVFCYLYLRVYPQRSLANAIWWGAWGGFFMVLPDGQFFVGTPNMGWSLLAMQWGEGIVTAILMMIFFQLVYRPANERWAPVPTDWRRFLVFGILSAILVFVLDIAFHQHVAQMIFDEYPAHDFPQRPAEEAAGLLPWLFLTYLFQLSIFCYLFLRVYPRRGMGNAIWFGAWLGVWVVIPNMQFFVGLDKYTWHMLIIQVPEGAILTMIMMVFFEWAYRPKTSAASLAAAE